MAIHASPKNVGHPAQYNGTERCTFPKLCRKSFRLGKLRQVSGDEHDDRQWSRSPESHFFRVISAPTDGIWGSFFCVWGANLVFPEGIWESFWSHLAASGVNCRPLEGHLGVILGTEIGEISKFVFGVNF